MKSYVCLFCLLFSSLFADSYVVDSRSQGDLQPQKEIAMWYAKKGMPVSIEYQDYDDSGRMINSGELTVGDVVPQKLADDDAFFNKQFLTIDHTKMILPGFLTIRLPDRIRVIGVMGAAGIDSSAFKEVFKDNLQVVQ